MAGPFKKPPTSILALAFQENRVQVVHLRRSGSDAQLLKDFQFELSGSAMALEAAVLGAELRKELEEHDIKESKCVVALPVPWVLNFQVEIPEMPEEDAAAFIATEAERNFPYDPDSLYTSPSRSTFAGKQYATVAGVQREQVLKLQEALKLAHLKVLSFTVGISAVQPPDGASTEPLMALAIGSKTVEMEVTAGGGVLLLRALEGALGADGADSKVYADVVGRELRVSLGQLPESVQKSLRQVRIFGLRSSGEQLLSELTPRLSALGLAGELARYSAQPVEMTDAFAAGARFLLQKKAVFEFLPPKISAWKQFSSKTSSKKIAWAAAAVGAAAVLIAGAFFIQNWQLSKLRTQWTAMEPRVKDLQDMQQQIKRFRPWFDTSFRTLSILKKLTEAFPVDGIVTAKSVEIRSDSQVICSGVARDNQALFRIMDNLRTAREISDLNGPDYRGKNPLQFTFNFKWVGGGGVEHQ